MLVVAMLSAITVTASAKEVKNGIYVGTEQTILSDFGNLFLEQISPENTLFAEQIEVPEVIKASEFIFTSVHKSEGYMLVKTDIFSLKIVIQNGYLSYKFIPLDSSKIHYGDKQKIGKFIEQIVKQTRLVQIE